MNVSVGTFNLNNLFSRYNFKGEIKAIAANDVSVDNELSYEFGPGSTYKLRTYMGRLVKAKDPAKTTKVVDRIRSMDIDVLAVQEVEDIDTLKQFNRDNLGGMYDHVVLVEGNDPRLIDVGLLSRLPLGGVTSWHQTVHPDEPGTPVFGRDLLEIEVMNHTRSKKLFTIFNTHLKSHFVDFRDNKTAGEQKNTARRTRQAEAIADIIKARTRPDSRYILTGDMNDPPDSNALVAFATGSPLGLVDALSAPQETRPSRPDNPPPASASWTHRYKESGQPAEYKLYDHIWLSPALAPRLAGAWIDRREHHGGDGSDHDPAWVELQL